MNRRGQVFPFFILIFSVFMFALGVLIHTGIEIQRKILLQVTADSAAYAGAAAIAYALSPDVARSEEGGEENSIYGLNYKILAEYDALLGWLAENRDIAAVPTSGIVIADITSGRRGCELRCNEANRRNATIIVERYLETVTRIREYRAKIVELARQIGPNAQRIAEETVARNISELRIGASGTVNNPSAVASLSPDSPNAVLSFYIDQADPDGGDPVGLYLASEISTVPFAWVYYGADQSGRNSCSCDPCYARQEFLQVSFPVIVHSELEADDYLSLWYCRVNGQGTPNRIAEEAPLAWQRGMEGEGNIAVLPILSRRGDHSIPLRIAVDPARPDPFFLTALEWKPAKALSYFAGPTKLYAVSAAKPFAGDVLTYAPYGVKLEAIRKVLRPEDASLNRGWSRAEHEGDFRGVYQYLKKFVSTGDPDHAVRSFLH